MKISPARLASFEILLRIEKEKAFSSALLPIYEENLGEKDKGLCHEISLGVLRRQIYLDKIIARFSAKKLDLEVKIALRMGIYQMLFLDKIPAYSAINESVNLVQFAKKTSAKGLVNAVLRKVSQNKFELNFADEFEKISVENSHPQWLIKKWIEQFGIVETEKIAAANNQTPESNFRWTSKTSESTKNKSDWKQKELVELAEKGEIYFQDKASQLVTEVVGLQQDERFLDVCCAPGSKLSLIDSKFQISDSKLVFGGDFYFRRLQIARKNCRRQGLRNINFVQYDAEFSLPFGDKTFEVVLLDAPCSGTGTIRHNPEIRYFLKSEDFEELSAKQSKILENSANLVKGGGRLIYSTCSLEVEENERVIEKFLANNSQFQKVIPKIDAKFLTSENFARTFPQRDNMDGFFIAVLERKG